MLNAYNLRLALSSLKKHNFVAYGPVTAGTHVLITLRIKNSITKQSIRNPITPITSWG